MPQIHRYSVKNLFLVGLFCAVFAIAAITITAFSSLFWITSSANMAVDNSIQQSVNLMLATAKLPGAAELQQQQAEMSAHIETVKQSLQNDKFKVLMTLSVVAVVSLLIMALGVGLLSRVLFPSITRFLDAFDEYNAGEFSYRMADEQMPVELKQVASGFNSMAHQLEKTYAELAYNSVNDELTGVYNRRKFIMDLEREVKRAKRYRRGLSLVLIDMDNFKQINQNYGHECGDIVLRKVVDFMYQGIRDSDSLYRYGGEEFAVILVEISDKDTEMVAERIRSRIAESAFALPGGLNVQATVSIGIANFPNDSDNEISLIHAADEALYQAKEQGRNRTVHTNQVVRAKAG